MITQKHLTLKEAKNEVEILKHELEVYCTKRNVNFLKTQPSSINPQDIVVDFTHTNFDSFLNYVAKDEEYDVKIYGLLASIYSYLSFIAKEKERMAKNNEIEYIVYLREEEKKSWKEIDKTLHHGEDYSRIKYYRYKKMANKS